MCVAMECESGRVGDLSTCETIEEGAEWGRSAGNGFTQVSSTQNWDPVGIMKGVSHTKHKGQHYDMFPGKKKGS